MLIVGIAYIHCVFFSFKHAHDGNLNDHNVLSSYILFKLQEKYAKKSMKNVQLSLPRKGGHQSGQGQDKVMFRVR